MSVDTRVKETGEIFTAHWEADGRMAYELLDGASYSGYLYHGHQVDESVEPVQFVYTELERATFRADELEIVGWIRLHPRLAQPSTRN